MRLVYRDEHGHRTTPASQHASSSGGPPLAHRVAQRGGPDTHLKCHDANGTLHRNPHASLASTIRSPHTQQTRGCPAGSVLHPIGSDPLATPRVLLARRGDPHQRSRDPLKRRDVPGAIVVE